MPGHLYSNVEPNSQLVVSLTDQPASDSPCFVGWKTHGWGQKISTMQGTQKKWARWTSTHITNAQSTAWSGPDLKHTTFCAKWSNGSDRCGVGLLLSVHYPIMPIVHLKQSNIFDTLWIMSGKIRSLRTIGDSSLVLAYTYRCLCQLATEPALKPWFLRRRRMDSAEFVNPVKKSCLKSCSQGPIRCLSTWSRCPKCSC